MNASNGHTRRYYATWSVVDATLFVCSAGAALWYVSRGDAVDLWVSVVYFIDATVFLAMLGLQLSIIRKLKELN